MQNHDRMALEFLQRVGSDTIGVIDNEEKMAAALIFVDLRKRGLVVASIGENGPTYRLSNAGRAALREEKGE